MPKILGLIAAICSAGHCHLLPDDVGYADLFNDAMAEIVDAPLKLIGEPLPDWLDGAFYQTGPADWSVLGPFKSPNAIFGYGKVHKWDFHQGKVTFSTKFPKKHFTNNVNTFLMNDKIAILTDMMTIQEVDKDSLAFVDSINFTNQTGVSTGGSAHPHCMDDGSFLGLREVELGSKTQQGQSRFAVYKLHPENPEVVQDVVTINVPDASYTHSFGVTKGMQGVDYSVIVAQPFSFTNPFAKGGNTTVHLLPMDSGVSGHKQQSIGLDRFFFGHFANTFSPSAGKLTFDLNRQSEIFFARYDLKVQLNKTKRDNWAAEHGDAYSTLTRYEVDLEAGTVSQHKVFPDPKTQCFPESKWCEFDLFALHPEDYGRPYCGFWSQHEFFNSSSFGSQAVVRVELCGPEGPRAVASWYQRNAYPGEAQFVPKPGSADKTEGLIIFKIYEGDTKLSKLVVADAKTLRTLTTAVLPVRIPFTVHGNFYSREALETGQCQPTGVPTFV